MSLAEANGRTEDAERSRDRAASARAASGAAAVTAIIRLLTMLRPDLAPAARQLAAVVDLDEQRWTDLLADPTLLELRQDQMVPIRPGMRPSRGELMTTVVDTITELARQADSYTTAPQTQRPLFDLDTIERLSSVETFLRNEAPQPYCTTEARRAACEALFATNPRISHAQSDELGARFGVCGRTIRKDWERIRKQHQTGALHPVLADARQEYEPVSSVDFFRLAPHDHRLLRWEQPEFLAMLMCSENQVTELLKALSALGWEVPSAATISQRKNKISSHLRTLLSKGFAARYKARLMLSHDLGKVNDYIEIDEFEFGIHAKNTDGVPISPRLLLAIDRRSRFVHHVVTEGPATSADIRTLVTQMTQVRTCPHDNHRKALTSSQIDEAAGEDPVKTADLSLPREDRWMPGVPVLFITDQGSIMTSLESRTTFQEHGIAHHPVMGYAPHLKPYVERNGFTLQWRMRLGLAGSVMTQLDVDGTPLEAVPERHLPSWDMIVLRAQALVDELNHTPRDTLGDQTPCDIYTLSDRSQCRPPSEQTTTSILVPVERQDAKRVVQQKGVMVKLPGCDSQYFTSWALNHVVGKQIEVRRFPQRTDMVGFFEINTEKFLGWGWPRASLPDHVSKQIMGKTIKAENTARKAHKNSALLQASDAERRKAQGTPGDVNPVQTFIESEEMPDGSLLTPDDDEEQRNSTSPGAVTADGPGSEKKAKRNRASTAKGKKKPTRRWSVTEQKDGIALADKSTRKKNKK